MKKIIYLSGQINPENVANVAVELLETQQNKEYTEIELYIYSGGGFIYPAFALYDLVVASKIPVHTIANGYCASSAVIVLQAGKTRNATPNTIFMIHQSSYFVESSPRNEFQAQANEYELENEMFKNLTIQKSKLTKEYFDNLTTSTFLTSKQALEAGLIDGIH